MKWLKVSWVLVFCTACALIPAPTNDSLPPTGAGLPSASGPTSTAGAVTSAPKPPPTSPPSPSLLLDVVIDNIVIGPQDQIYVSGFGSSGGDLRLFAQWDGAQWIPLGSGFRTAGNSLVVDAAGHLYTEMLADSTQGCSTGILRWDGTGWENITGDFSLQIDALQTGRVSCNVPVTALAVGGGDTVYAGGMFFYQSPDQSTELPMGYVATWDGEVWNLLGGGFDKVNIFALAAGGPGDTFASGEQPLAPEGGPSLLARWHESGWEMIDTGGRDIILKLALDPSGRLYVAGQKSTHGAFVDDWDGEHWTIVASQFGGEAPAVFDLALDARGQLCVGGSFDSVDGVPANNVACWQGNAWQALGPGTNERVEALAFDSRGNLYAVGYFTEAGNQPVAHIARWDGQQWYSLGP